MRYSLRSLVMAGLLAVCGLALQAAPAQAQGFGVAVGEYYPNGGWYNNGYGVPLGDGGWYPQPVYYPPIFVYGGGYGGRPYRGGYSYGSRNYGSYGGLNTQQVDRSGRFTNQAFAPSNPQSYYNGKPRTSPSAYRPR